MPKSNKYPFVLFMRDNHWHYKISTVINGQRIIIRKSAKTKDEGEALKIAEQDYKNIISEYDFRTNPNKLKQYTLDKACALFWEEVGQYHSNSADTFGKIGMLLDFFDPTLPLHLLNIEDLSAFVAKRRKEVKNSTINRYLALLSAIIHLCQKHRIKTPDINVRQFMLRESQCNIKYFADWDVMDKIIDRAPEHLKPIIKFALYTGLRRGNILNLKWSDIVGNDIVIQVKSSKYEGGKSIRKAIIPEVREILDSVPHCSDYVFTYKGQRIRDIKRSWHTIFKDGSIPYQNFHTLRHTHASWLYKNTRDVLLVKESLNHSNLKMTERYTHLIDSRTSAISQAFAH